MPIKLDFPGDEPGATPIVKAEIQKLIGNYVRDMRPGDTRSAWVSAEEISALLKDNDADGIRIYYGRHKKDDKLFPDQHNVILVATKNSKPGSVPCYRSSVDQLNEFKSNGPVNSVTFNFHHGDYVGRGDDAIPLCPQNCPESETLQGWVAQNETLQGLAADE